MNPQGQIFYLLLSVFIVGFIGFFWISRFLAKRDFRKSFGLRLLLIRLPQILEEKEKPTKENPLQELNLTGQLLGILSSLKSPFALEAAVHGVGEDINFYLAVPRQAIQFASRAVQGIWEDAEITEVEDYNIFNPKGAAEGAILKLKKHYALPIRAFTEANLDTFAPILSHFSKLHQTDEGMALQLVVSSAPRATGKNISSILHRLRKGVELEKALKTLDLSDFVKTAEKAREKERPEPKSVDEAAVKALEQKISKPLFRVNIRLVASAEKKERAKELLEAVANSFNQFTGPLRNEFGFIRVSRPEKFAKFIFRQFDSRQSMILSADETASIFHFPSSTLKVPKINWLKFKESAPPLDLPAEGVYLGESLFRGEARPIFIKEEDRLKHLYLIGQTGTGKSNLLNILARSDIKNGKGVAIIDPHGSLIESVLGAIPEERYEDVILFDPADIEWPIGLNMLEYSFSHPEQKTFVVNELFSILDKLYDMKIAGGPMFEQYTRNALLLLLEDMPNEPATLMEIPRIFNDDEFRERKLERITNPTVIDFWEREAVMTTGEHSLANMASWITSKFNNFIANDYMRPIIGQPKSAFNFREIMDQGKILLVNLSKGRIGDVNANLLGMILVGKILMAALSRTDVSEEKRPTFNLYIDEFQNFTTDSISIILSEARKYRLSLTIAHQFIGQLTEKIRDAVFGNVGSMVVFRVGIPDAEFLVKQFEPFFSKRDLISIDNLNAYTRLLIDGKTSQPFNVSMEYEGGGDPELMQKLKEVSRRAYGRDRKEVEAEILKRLRE